MSSFNRNQDQSDENEPKKSKSRPSLLAESSYINNKGSISSQKDLIADQMPGEKNTQQLGKVRLPDKDDKKMKRYLIKIFEKLKEGQNNMSCMIENNESPDLLNEHSNSVQEQLLKKENQSSLTDFNSSLIIKNGRGKEITSGPGGLSNGRNGISNIKMQFHTQNNFYPSTKSSQAIFKSRTTGNQPYNASKQQKAKKYENTDNLIQEESGEDNQIQSEDDEEDFQLPVNHQNGTNIQQHTEKLKINRVKKLKKNSNNNLTPNQGNNILAKGENIIDKKQKQQQRMQNLEDSPSQLPNQIYQNNPQNFQIPILSRGTNNHNIFHNNNSTSVPRPTLASEIKLLKEINGQSPQGFNKKISNQFIQNNNLANFMWNSSTNDNTEPVTGKINQREILSKQGNRPMREYNLLEGSNQPQGRPMTRSNQRRPVSRQVNQFDNSGIGAQKMLVQQQMRNTHFGDGGFGFAQKLKEPNTKQNENILRESLKNGTGLSAQINGIISGGGNTVAVLTQNNAQILNRSITFNNKNQNLGQSHSIPINNQNNHHYEQISTQESSGSHFYQPSTFLNKSIESSSSRGIIISAKYQQNANAGTINQIIRQNSGDQVKNEIEMNNSIIQGKQKINLTMGGTQYDNNCFKLITREDNGNSQHIYSHQQQQLPLKHFQNIKNGSFKEQAASPHLSSIQEIANQQPQNMIFTAASNTQSKFYQQQNNNQRQPIQRASRNITGHLQQQNSDSTIEAKKDIRKQSQNTTQEKFYPQRQQYNSTNTQNNVACNSNPQVFNQNLNGGTNIQQLKQHSQQKGFNIKNEVKISLEFVNQNGQTQQDNEGVQNVKRRQSNKSKNHRMKDGAEMIKEEQHEEISDDELDQNKGSISKPIKVRIHEKSIDDYQSQDSIQVSSQPILSQTGQIERPNNRLGCSRAFHKDVFKESVNEYSSLPQNYHPNQCGAHSMPRSNNHNNQSFQENDQNVSKTSSSATSLTISKQGISGSMQNQQNTYQGSSISPKPNKWQQSTKDTNTSINISMTQGGKFQEMQRDVNIMYLGQDFTSSNAHNNYRAIQQKKKASAGIKLNPIHRIPGNESQYTSANNQNFHNQF
ncbi:UNKNOWN [Stylonychia lemnae]|uniref:Uncharacterized protein n=1 Tax=Stylonychia lemnae TaxID=5949 RepID=A0A078AAF9_STYLE|nr:UNKNOWN [Stylonychia lemnae]|eukprot:CDW78577.1 UNKNOWN [Stylonychia lemnae]